MVSWPGVVCSIVTSKQMKQINDLELTSGIELVFGSFLTRDISKSEGVHH